MSLINDALNLAKTIAPLLGPQGLALSAALNIASKVLDFAAPIVNNLVNSSPLPDEAKDLFNTAYRAGFGG